MKTENLQSFNMKEFLIIVFSTLFTFLAPITGIFAALIMVSIGDHFAGVWKAKKKGEKLFFWWGMWTSLTKAVLYMFIVTCVYVLDFNALDELLKALTNYFFNIKIYLLITKIVGIALFIHELKSIDRNYKEIKGVSMFSALFDVLKSGRKQVNEIIKTKNGLIMIGLFMSVSFLYSCRSAEWHYNKAIEKGIEIKKEVDTIKVTSFKIDSFPIYINKDSIKWEYKIKEIKKDSLIYFKCPDFSRTKRNLNYQLNVLELKARKLKDSLDFNRKIFLIDSRNRRDEAKINKQVKTEKTTFLDKLKNVFLIFGFCFGSFVAGYFFSKFK